MKATAIWLDRIQAKIFYFPRNSRDDEIFHASRVEHHTHERNALDVKREERKMFEKLAKSLKDSDDILILGPGVAKLHFQTYLVEHHPIEAKKIRICQAMDHPTDNQIIAFTNSFLLAHRMASSG